MITFCIMYPAGPAAAPPILPAIGTHRMTNMALTSFLAMVAESREQRTRGAVFIRTRRSGCALAGASPSARLARGVAVAIRRTRSASNRATQSCFWPRCHGTTPNLRKSPDF